MFHFPTFPPHALCVQARVTPHDWCGVPPFGHPRINARLTAPRGLSQPPTSFIGSWCQGIHRAPLLAWPQRCSRPLCSSQGAGGPGRHPPPGHFGRSAVRRTTGPPVAKRRTGPCGISLAGRRFTGRANGLCLQSGPFPQDPTTCPAEHLSPSPFLSPKGCTRRGSRCSAE